MKQSVWMTAVGVLVFAFMLVPVAIIIWMSFFDQSYLTFPPEGYTLKWFFGLANESALFEGLLYSAQIAAITTVVSLFLG